jgi:glycosyltransferase involved in cell wall biosynthesis
MLDVAAHHQTTGAAIRRRLDDPRDHAPVLDLAVPVYNEEHVLRDNVQRLHAYLTERFPFAWRITVVDNGSTDGTWYAAAQLARDLRCVRALHLDRKGRGLALRSAWSDSDATVVAYTDVDLSTGLDALLPLVTAVLSGHSDIAIGSRLAPGAAVQRCTQREVLSRCYNVLLRFAFATHFRDAQCGFKALRADVARELVPAVQDDAWFFDTELLLLAERKGLRVREVPVDWTEDRDSRVDVPRTVLDDLRGVVRMLRTPR